jgi:DNA-directed RNA polymerase specialized sigma24 family protein
MTFRTTCWSELALASLDGDTNARSALENLCQRYYEPVRQFILRRGHHPNEAEDLTQDFFLRFLGDRSWKRAERARGSFRNFLLGALAHHLEDAERHRRRQKRGGGLEPFSLDHPLGAEALGLPAVAPPTDSHFDRAWALKLLEAALARVHDEYCGSGKMEQYQKLKVYLPGSDAPPPYEERAAELGLTITGLKAQIHRLRQSFRRAVREEVADTVSAPHEIDAELRYLQAALAQHFRTAPETPEPPPGNSE